MPSNLDIASIFSADVDPDVALTICERYARSLVALHDDTGDVPQRDQDVFVAMLAEIFDHEATKDYLKQHKQGPIVEWMTRFPDALEMMLQRFIRG